MATPTIDRLAETLSLAIEDRGDGFSDVAKHVNPIMECLVEKDMYTSYEGPSVRERVRLGKNPNTGFYSGSQVLGTAQVQIFRDAEFTPKNLYTSVTLDGPSIVGNMGNSAQLLDLLDSHMEAADSDLHDKFDEATYDDGTGDGGLSFQGLGAIFPSVTNSGVYGSIDRATYTDWRPGYYSMGETDSNMADYIPGTGTAIDKANVPIAFQFVTQMHKGPMMHGPDLFICDRAFYQAFQQSLLDIQRVNSDASAPSRSRRSREGTWGFTSLKFMGVTGQVDVVYAGGIGAAIQDNTCYAIDTDSIKFRYNRFRNFDRLSDAQKPVAQDAVVQQIGVIGNLTCNAPLYNARIAA